MIYGFPSHAFYMVRAWEEQLLFSHAAFGMGIPV